jgi:hypothetical protein
MERLGQTKVTYTHSRDALRNPLNIDLNINNERQDYKIGTVWGNTCEMGEGK